jgi:flagellar motor switch protein FliN/FliY
MDEAMTNEVNDLTNPAEMPPEQTPAGPDLSALPEVPDLQAGIEAEPDLSAEVPDINSPPAPETPEIPAAPTETDGQLMEDQAAPPAEAYTPAVSRPVPAEFEAFVPDAPKDDAKIGMLMDVALNVTVELGRTRIPVREVLDLQSGSVIELEREAGEVVDIFVNEHLIAKGEVVVVDDKYGIRITEFLKNERVVGVG